MNIPFRERGAFIYTRNSISINVDKSYIDKISKLPQVKRVLPLHAGSEICLTAANALPGQVSPFHHLIPGVDTLHQKRIEDQGIKIGIIATGADYTHPIVGGCFGKRLPCRLWPRFRC
jgi:hypothetical protein